MQKLVERPGAAPGIGSWGMALILIALPASAQRTFDTDILTETFGFDDTTLKSVPLDQLQQGCPARDCIPSIDDPKFVDATTSTVFLYGKVC